MVKLTEIKRPDFSSIATDFSAIATQFDPSQLSGLTSSLTFPTDLLPTNFDALTGVVNSFSGLVQNLPTSTDDLLGDLLGELKQLSGGSEKIGQLFSGFITPFTRAGTVFGESQTVFTTLTTELIPTLVRLKDDPIDAATLGQLLPIATLATPLTTQLPNLLRPQLQQVQAARSHLIPLLTATPLAEYQAMLEAIAALPLDPSLTVNQLPSLDTQQASQIKSQIQTLTNQAQTATHGLQTVQQSLEGASTGLNDALDNTLSQLSPQRLAQKSTVLGNVVSTLEPLSRVDLDSMVSQLQGVIQPLQRLLDQGIETATAGVNTMVKTVDKAIATADQALVKVSALVTNVIDQLIGFIETLDLTSLINQSKDIFQSLMLKLNGVLNQVGTVMEQVYDFVHGMVDKVLALGDQLPPLAEKFRQLLAQITALLENPQFKDGVQKAKQGIDQVVEKLDSITLQPVFDQVLTKVNEVKASLQAIDLSQLNQLLKSALSAALELVKGAIDPPSKVTAFVQEQYDTLISDPIINELVQPVQDQIDSVVNLIYTLEPGTLAGKLLTPLYEQLLAAVKSFVEPDRVAILLKPLTDFQTSLMKQLDEVLNPRKLLAPLVDLYGQIMGFVRSLTPDIILQPLNELLQQATQPLENLGLDQVVMTIETSVRTVKSWINNINIDDQFLEKGIESLINTWVQNLKGVVNQLDLSGIQTLLQPLRSAATTLLAQTQLGGTASLEVVKQVKDMAAEINQFTTGYGEQMSALALAWQTQRDRLQSFTPPAELAPQYNALKEQLNTLNPITLLAAATQSIDRLNDAAKGLLNTLETTWKGLGDRLQQGQTFLNALTSAEASDLKAYVNQAIDALVESTLNPLIQIVNKPLMQMKGVIQSIRQLQGSLAAIDVIPESVRTLKGAIDTVIGKIRAFNFNFLREPLSRVKQQVEQPLELLNPEPMLIMPLTQIYNKVLKMLENLNPVHLFATPRTKDITIKSAASGFILLSLGTQLEATTPLGEKVWFETLVEQDIPANGEVQVSVRALVAGRSSDIVAVEGVTWQVENQPELQVIQSQPILSLVTLVKEKLLGILKVFDPVELIAQPLNEQFQKIVALIQDLGITKLFDAFFEKLDCLDGEIKAGLGRLGGSFGGLVAAFPL